MQVIRVQSLGWEDPLEKEMAAHSSILAWKIPRMEKPGGLLSMGLKESDMTEQLHFHLYVEPKYNTNQHIYKAKTNSQTQIIGL